MHLLWVQLYFSVFHYAFQTGWGIHVSVWVDELVLGLHEIYFGRFTLTDEGASEVYVRLDQVVLHRSLIELVAHSNALLA